MAKDSTNTRTGRMNSTLLAAGLESKKENKKSDQATSESERASIKAEEEKATERVTAYFTLTQYDAIEELQKMYRKRTGKRITVNALLRLIVDTISIDDILK